MLAITIAAAAKNRHLVSEYYTDWYEWNTYRPTYDMVTNSIKDKIDGPNFIFNAKSGASIDHETACHLVLPSSSLFILGSFMQQVQYNLSFHKFSISKGQPTPRKRAHILAKIIPQIIPISS